MPVPSIAFSTLAASISGELHLPDPTLPRGGIVDRWSELRVGTPAATVVPLTEQDVVASIAFARAQGLKVRVAGGQHSTAVPVDEGVLYVDMRRFDGIALGGGEDDDEGGNGETVVTVGAGVTTGGLNAFLARRGLCTAGPNANSIGTVGCALGGGSGYLNGVTGLMADLVRGFRVVTADGRVLTLPGASADEEERALFRCLRGAGPGLVVVLSMTLAVVRMDEDLGLVDGKAWTRRLVFPPSEVRAVGEAWAAVHAHHGGSLPAKLQLVLAFLRAPPGSPTPWAPSVLLAATYTGPPEEGERHAAPLFEPALVGRAVLADATSLPVERLNDATEMLEKHGGCKTSFSAFVRALQPGAVVDLFERWRRAGDVDCPAGLPSVLAVCAWNTDALKRVGAREETFVDDEARRRGVLMLVYNWWVDDAATDYMLGFGADLLDIVRRDAPAGDAARSYANNLRYGMDMTEVYSAERIEEIRRVKRVWDEGNLFYCPSSK